MVRELKAEAPTAVLESKWTIKIADVYRFSVTIPWDNSNCEHYIKKLKEQLPTVQYPPNLPPLKTLFSNQRAIRSIGNGSHLAKIVLAKCLC